MFEERCKYAKYPNEMPALLLPYLDFSLGRGKMVEVMGKGAVGLCMKKMKAKVGDGPDAGEKKKTLKLMTLILQETLVGSNPPNGQIIVSLITTLIAHPKLYLYHLICS